MPATWARLATPASSRIPPTYQSQPPEANVPLCSDRLRPKSPSARSNIRLILPRASENLPDERILSRLSARGLSRKISTKLQGCRISGENRETNAIPAIKNHVVNG